MVAMTKDQILASIAGAAATLALIILTLTSDDGTPHPSISLSLRTGTGSRRLQTAVTPSLVIDPKTVTPRIPLSPDSSFVSPSPPSSSLSLSDPIHILITVCNGHGARDGTAGRYQEVVDQLRTIQRYGMAHSQDEIVVHIFTDDPNTLQNDFIQTPITARLTSNLNIGVYPLPPPKSSTENYHKFHTCASARMYAPHLFTSVYGNDIPRRVIYLDTDTLVTAPLRNLWDMSRTLFAEHDGQHGGHAALFGTAQECLSSPNEEGYAGGGENTPYKFTNARNCEGYNSGVLIAHLHRWRNQYFSGMVLEQEIHAKENEYGMKYGDQGILNAMSSRFPERHVTIPCWWNLRTDTMEKCLENYWKNGGGVVHGSRSVFHDDNLFSKPASVDLHDYLVRDNDMLSLEEVNDLRSKMERYDQNDVENEMFASILRQLIEREVHLLTE